MFLLGATYGSLTKSVEDLARDNPTLEKFFQAAGQGSLVDSFLATMLLVLALLTAAYATSSASRLSAEESAGRSSRCAPPPASRARAGWPLAATVLGSALVLVAGGGGLGASYGLSVGDPGEALRLAAQQLGTSLPCCSSRRSPLCCTAGPPGGGRRSGWCLPCGSSWTTSAGLLDVPQWLVSSSPFAHIPEVPVADLTWGAPAVIALLCVALTALGVAGFRRRDIGLTSRFPAARASLSRGSGSNFGAAREIVSMGNDLC